MRPRLELWPETIQRLMRARDAAPRVDLAPGAAVETTVAPTVLK